MLEAALLHDEPLVRGHAAWALGRIASAGALGPLRPMEAAEPERPVPDGLRAAARALDG